MEIDFLKKLEEIEWWHWSFEKIKENFSDQVAVKPVDNTSGIIVPQFKNKQGDDYLYMMVPVKNN